MKIVSFEPTREIAHYDSHGASIGGVARCEGTARIAVLELAPGGVVGMHPAVGPQLVLVVDGDAWVRTEGGERVRLERGGGAFWTGGEMHETSTDGGLTAIVVEADSLELA